ncbi:hypothetical protein J8L70_09565 [Pseudoalteromonas sp. MMG010]|uniref:hypothetical protein n=1 Tax=Pseudoalteromonas sp. MMG010 TaxID=2822685 RepID=UPI001B39EC5E|nr:hypothetical protein [Pseudoalteromonas sp. MMG010]MBQ4833485.1 hypothetical protein [Pseudoalteromonas sp. MMG010]
MKEIASAQVTFDKSTDIKTLRKKVKEETELVVRRMDSFTLIALLAVYKATKNLQLNDRIGLYSCADYFSSELMQSMLQDLAQQEAIKPLSFVATVGNAANYYLASTFSINGPNVFLGCSEQAQEKSRLLINTDMSLKLIDFAVMVIWQEDSKARYCRVKVLAVDGFVNES